MAKNHLKRALAPSLLLTMAITILGFIGCISQTEKLDVGSTNSNPQDRSSTELIFTINTEDLRPLDPGAKIGQNSSVDRDEVSRKVRSHLSALRRCYEIALVENKKLSGKIVLHWEIDDTGKVTEAIVERSEMKPIDNKFNTCLLETIKGIAFPKAPDGDVVKVKYPIIFSSN